MSLAAPLFAAQQRIERVRRIGVAVGRYVPRELDFLSEASHAERAARFFAGLVALASVGLEIARELVTVRANPLVRVPSHMVLLGRTLGLLSGLAQRLATGVDPMLIIFPYIVGSQAR